MPRHTTRARGVRSSRWPGTAAATLTGLFFVAFSLRVRELQVSRVLRMRTRYLLTWLIAIAIGSGFVVIPGSRVARWRRRSSPYRRAARRRRSGRSCEWIGGSYPRSPPIWSAGGWAWGNLAAQHRGGVSLAVGHGGGLYLLAFAMLLGIALEVAAAWTLVVEAGKDPRDKDVVPGPEDAAEPPRAGQLAAGEDGSRPVPGQ